jgi:hypothetical protein
VTAWTGGHLHLLSGRVRVAHQCGARGNASGGRRWLGCRIDSEAPAEKRPDGRSMDQRSSVVADELGRLVGLMWSPWGCQLDQMEVVCGLRKMPLAISSTSRRRCPLSDDGGTQIGGDKL